MIRVVTILSVACALVGVLFLATSSSAVPMESPRFVAVSTVDGILVAAKSCSTSSDCPHSKCSNGQCGGCSTTSDCGFGQCSGGKCGACSTSSDCKGWGSCSSGQCGSCSTSSDCGSWGSCSSGRCEKTPY